MLHPEYPDIQRYGLYNAITFFLDERWNENGCRFNLD